jgi:hypothetical protein
MRKLISSAAFLVLGVGAASTAQAQIALKGSDTLEDVAKFVLDPARCPAAVGVTYAGGGSGSGQAAMTAATPTQQIAPMSRELNGTGCVATASELVIGLDGLSIVGANQTGGDSETTTAGSVCNDNIAAAPARTMPVQFGGCSAGEIASGACDPASNYTFTSWKDVLKMVYGGENNGTAARTLADKTRNHDKIDCAGNIRRTLVDSWGQIFTTSSVGTAACRTGTCTRLKHAFRRGDLSGTTDAFIALVGMQSIPPFTSTSAGNVPKVDSAATINPFCNAGEKIMNKGDSDYLDMDPIRRIADSAAGGQNRQGKEQVTEGFWSPSNPPPAGGGDSREVEDPAAAATALKPLVPLPDFSHPAAQNWSFDPNTAGSLASQRDSFVKLTSPTTGNGRFGLGVVLVIEIPTNYNSTTRTYFEATSAGGPPVPCTPGKFAPSIICPTCINVLCPDGGQTTCTLPVDTTVVGTLANPNYNCLSDRATPTPPPGALALKDPRVYNLLVVDQTGKVIKDNYTNPNLTLSATRQNRLVSAFFRLHTSEVTNFGGNPTIAGNPTPGTPSTANVCNKFTSTDQIGCLVRATPCSLGYAGREANNNVTTFAAQVENVQANTTNVKNFIFGLSPAYPISRGLYVNSVKGFGSVVDVAGPPSDNELSALTCFGGGPGAGGPNDPRNPTSPVHQAMSNFGFIPLEVSDPAIPASFTTCP